VVLSLGYHILGQINLDSLKFTQALDDRNSNQLFRREEVIQWVFKTSRSNAPIVGRSSSSQLVSKSSMHLVAYRMNLNVVPSAAEPESQNAMQMVATSPDDRCSRQYVPAVAKTPKYRSSPAMIDRYIAVIATLKSDWADKASLLSKTW
jgi:hypothetical protein